MKAVVKSGKNPSRGLAFPQDTCTPAAGYDTKICFNAKLQCIERWDFGFKMVRTIAAFLYLYIHVFISLVYALCQFDAVATPSMQSPTRHYPVTYVLQKKNTDEMLR